jgi:hypothetical protein
MPRNVAEVRNSIIEAVTIDVVNLMVRPIAVMDRPSNPVGLVRYMQYLRHKVASDLHLSECFFARKPSVECAPVAVPAKHLARPLLPKQFPRLGLVAKQLAAQFRRDIGSVSHVADSLRCGQGRAALQPLFRPAFPNRIPVCSQPCETANG